MLGKPVTTYKDIVSGKLSSMPAAAPPKNALAVCVQPSPYPPPPSSKIVPPGTMGKLGPLNKGAEEPISAEDAAQVAEPVGRERTSAC